MYRIWSTYSETAGSYSGHLLSGSVMSEQSDDKKEREIEESAECNRDNLRDFVVEAYSHQAQSLVCNISELV